MDVYRGFNEGSNSWSGLGITTDYKERISYDGNGNILKYLRNGISGISSQMDSLSYHYYSGTNRLKYVRDNVGDGVYNQFDHSVEDINNQTNTGNYTYSEIGNVEKDVKDSIKLIKWNVYGKITEIQRTASTARPVTNIKYTYDASGNRISKRVVTNQNNIAEYTWYVRDASGNVMATYTGSGQASTTLFSSNYNLQLGEQHIYGSSRVGVLNRNFDVKTAYVRPSVVTFERGNKFFELSNHLGNVLVTISDKKIGIDTNTDGEIDYYTADVVTAQDYYPFGMIQPGRRYAQGNSKYRYSINGQEKDSELNENITTALYWEYDSRIGKRWNVDPRPSTDLSPYSVFINDSLNNIDINGDTSTPKKLGIVSLFRSVSKNNGGPFGKLLAKIIPDNSTGESIAGAFTGTGQVINDGFVGGIEFIKDPITSLKAIKYSVENPTQFTISVSQQYLDTETKFGSNYTASHYITYGVVSVLTFLRGNFVGKNPLQKIVGKAQSTGTPGHSLYSKLLAWRYALDPRVEKVMLNRGYKTLIGPTNLFKYGPRPDVGVLFKNGKILVIEVASKSDIEQRLYYRNFNFIQKLPVDGEVKVKMLLKNVNFYWNQVLKK